MDVRNLQVQLLLACLGCARLASAGEIQVTLKPNKPVYVLGEPVVCDLAIRNVSTQDLGIGFSYPNWMGLRFPGKEVSIPVLASVCDWTVPLERFAANQEYRAKIALNRYVPISGVGEYQLRYAASYHLISASEARKGTSRTAVEEGLIAFSVVTGVLNEEALKSFEDALNQEDYHALEEAIEMVIWIDDPRAVRLLQKASQITFTKGGARGLAHARWTILHGLAKFLHVEDARTTFFALAGQSDGRDMRIAYQICLQTGVQAPDAIVKGGLGSGEFWKAYSSLEYLLGCGTPVQAEWVVPLTKDENPNIRALAEKVLAKFKEDAEKKKGK